MPRPPKERRIEQLPPILQYKPVGTPLKDLEQVILMYEEMEAIRLSDMELLGHIEAAARMEISSPTFNRILNSAHQKIAAALWQGKALAIEGGNFRIATCGHRGMRHFLCEKCNHEWEVPHGTGQRGRDMRCPTCGADSVIRNHQEK